MLYFSTKGKHYQVYDCEVKINDGWTKTSQVVDIIMYKLEEYKKYLGGLSLGFDLYQISG